MIKTTALRIGEVCATPTPIFPRRLGTYHGNLNGEAVLTSRSGRGSDYTYVLFVPNDATVWQHGDFSVIDTKEATPEVMKRTRFETEILPNIQAGALK